jgi:hypothetical protein
MNQRASLAAYRNSIAAAQKIIFVRSKRSVQLQVLSSGGHLTRRILLDASNR